MQVNPCSLLRKINFSSKMHFQKQKGKKVKLLENSKEEVEKQIQFKHKSITEKGS